MLDASAFYAGVPFGSAASCYTTPLVYDEISHIKKSHGALDALLEVGKLKIVEPGAGSFDAAVKAAKRSGDIVRLSRQDISIIALGLEIGGEIVTDDFAVANVARGLGMRVHPVMTKGIRDVGRWVSYCPGCKSRQDGGSECGSCGTPLRRRLVK